MDGIINSMDMNLSIQYRLDIISDEKGLTEAASWRCVLMGKEEGGTNNTKVSAGRNAGRSLRTLWGMSTDSFWGTDRFLWSNEKTRLVRCRL